jgi:multidrug efflux pump subunit AcrA (membrane-fusion protein)
MKPSSAFLILLAVLPPVARGAEEAVDPVRTANTIILNEAGVRNLGIETIEVTESTFEETAFALGRIDEIPDHHAVVSSRIAGRVTELLVQEGDVVEAGQTIVRIESRQPGNPPPVITLNAPIGGLVVTSHVRLGEPVEPEKELLDISNLNEVWAVARVPENHAGQLAPGSLAHISVPALGKQSLSGEMLRFGTAADAASGTIDAVFRVTNPGMRLRPGMRAEFEIVLSKRDNVLCVPREAVQGGPANRHVFIKDFDIPNAFVRTPVRVGQTSGGKVEILSGLFPGDLVVTTGSYPLGFAGGGSVSLREALDAAHGHEHNEDGTVKSPDGAHAEEGDDGHGHDAEKTGGWSPREKILLATSGLLAAMLLAALFTKRGVAPSGANHKEN